MNMKSLIKFEELFIVVLCYYLFLRLDYAWWWFFLLFLVPDVSMIGYLINPKVGAATYNVVHHKAVAIVIYTLGGLFSLQLPQLIGLVMLGHSSLDRVFGYGLKYLDAFRHTHLGTIGNR